MATSAWKLLLRCSLEQEALEARARAKRLEGEEAVGTGLERFIQFNSGAVHTVLPRENMAWFIQLWELFGGHLRPEAPCKVFPRTRSSGGARTRGVPSSLGSGVPHSCWPLVLKLTCCVRYKSVHFEAKTSQPLCRRLWRRARAWSPSMGEV